MVDTKKEKKNRIFYPNRVYVVDRDNYIIKQGKNFEDVAQDYTTYMPSDTVLVSLHVSELKKYLKKKIDKVVFDFDKKILTITGDEGGEIRMAMTDYEVGVHELEPDELKSWQKMMADAKDNANTVETVGRPPIAGTYLEYDRDE